MHLCTLAELSPPGRPLGTCGGHLPAAASQSYCVCTFIPMNVRFTHPLQPSLPSTCVPPCPLRRPHSGLPLQGLLATLDEAGRSLDSAAMSARGFAYQAVGSLAGRLPSLLHGQLDVARRFFDGGSRAVLCGLQAWPCHPCCLLGDE